MFMPRPHPKTLLAASAIVALMLPSLALAHGGDPLPRDLHPVSDDAWVLATNFGIIRSEDPRHYVCEEAFLGGDNFLYTPLADLTWVTFSETRVMRTEDGCDFEEVMKLTEVPVAVSSDLTTRHVAFITNQDDLAALQVSDDEGKSWRGVTLEPGKEVHWTGVELSGEDSAFLSGYSREEADKGAALLYTVALDSGELTLHELPAEARYPYLSDASGGRVAGQVNMPDGIALLWGTPDNLAVHPLESWPTDIELADDGATIYASATTPEGGVLVGTWEGDSPTFGMLLPEHSARCVTDFGEDLYICARRDREGHDLSRYSDGEITPAVEFKQLLGPPTTCPEDSDTARTCKIVWPELAKALRLELPDQEAPADMGSAADEDMGGGPPIGMDMATDDSDQSYEPPGPKPMPEETCSALPTQNHAPVPLVLFGVILLGGVCARSSKTRPPKTRLRPPKTRLRPPKTRLPL
jgi:hypothetical protein